MQADKNQIFSQEALDKLRSPEKSDTMLPITAPISRITLIAISVLLYGALIEIIDRRRESYRDSGGLN